MFVGPTGSAGAVVCALMRPRGPFVLILFSYISVNIRDDGENRWALISSPDTSLSCGHLEAGFILYTGCFS